MAQNITLLGASYSAVPAVELPKTGGGTARFDDCSVVTAVAEDVAQGKVFVANDGTVTTGTASGGGGSTSLILGAIRPDSELVHSYTFDQMLVADMGITKPSYTTTATTLKASETLGTVSMDFNNYDYYVVERMLAKPVYNVTTKAKGRMEYNFISALYEIATIPANTFIAFDGTKLASRNTVITQNLYQRLFYFSSDSAVSVYSTAQNGTYFVIQSPSLIGTTLTVKSPAINIRGNTVYFTQTYWNAMTDARYQYIIEVYRAPRGNLNLNGWGGEQQGMHILDCINNNDGTLT